MKILKSELYKLFTSPIFIFAAAAAIILNMYLCMSAQPVSVSDDEYKSFYQSLEGLTEEEKAEYAENALQELYSAEISYENLMKRAFYRGEAESAVLISRYEEYLDGVYEAAERMTTISIFADKNSFSYRNITLTPAAYDAVRNVKPSYSPSQGVLMAICNNGTDIMMFFIVIAAVTVLFVKEREASVIALLKPLRYGRARLAALKSLTVLTVCIISAAVIYGSALFIGAARFGLGDMSRPIQSLEGFLGCNLPVSVLQGTALIFLFKIAALFLGGLIFECLCTALFSLYAYIGAVTFAAAEIFLYSSIESNSWAAAFGRINLAAFTDSARMFNTYLNINLFGYPYNIITVAAISVSVGIILAFMGELLLFSGISVKDFKTKQALPSIRYIPKKPFSYGLYKAFVTHKGAIIILAVAAVQIYSAANYTISYSSDDLQYHLYCDILSQMTEEQAEEFVDREERRFEELYASLFTADEYRIQSISESLQAWQGFEQAREQQQYISSLDSENKAMFYLTGWRRLFGADSYREDITLVLFAALGVCFSVSPMISYDNRRRLGFLLYTNQYGRKKYFGQNLAVCALISFLISAVINIPRFIGILSLYKTEGSEFSIRCIKEFEGFFDISIAAYTALLFILRTVFLILCGIIVLYISSKCLSTYTALLISLAVFALPAVLYLVGADFALPLCMPFGINTEIIEGEWVYPAVVIIVSLVSVGAEMTTSKRNGIG